MRQQQPSGCGWTVGPRVCLGSQPLSPSLGSQPPAVGKLARTARAEWGLLGGRAWEGIPFTFPLSTGLLSDVQVTEDAVRRYLTRKPMTTKDLLKKFQTKKTGLSSEQTVNVLAQILKRLNPERKMINDKMHFSLKE